MCESVRKYKCERKGEKRREEERRGEERRREERREKKRYPVINKCRIPVGQGRGMRFKKKKRNTSPTG